MSSLSNLKPIKIWGKGGPNPPKVAMIASELGIPHEIVDIQFSELKKPDFLAINPNGRMPAIQDPNTDLTLWESGAIVEYLIEKYDTERKLSFEPGTNEAYHAKQWLFFPDHGPGPLLRTGRLEIIRVTTVLEGELARQQEAHGNKEGFSGPWLVGNKLSYADFAFYPWQWAAQRVLGDDGEYKIADFPLVKAWLEKLNARESVKYALPE
ncbi:hypothetical protein CHGG_00887 [Chaetomium globosum CBS 148.51]|uniref:Glutathione S-transferase n=1 Tax=Chaetomium globosum (strain ATCC 6205 / CBS 148.51 / DSM 1962 / NBRC 6347 / NRRL 1970) TaxID=306901 RepID=Q2HFW7_CHAGB|nr:uncharacterized protein CHGG_00887 [Chaetomium globosum CBS 148.51]EAQ92652.1 hypothetical protein CHGG_00887 [Chaetomium globosum CBS 148.51]